MVKVPNAPPADVLRATPPEVRTVPRGAILFRVYFLGGEFPVAWNGLRYWGPHPSGGRFDHHIPPPSTQSRGILYAAAHPRTCLAEAFQETRHVDPRTNAPYLVGFRLATSVSLLDLTGLWPTRAGASAAIASGARPRAQMWARSIYLAYPDLEGVVYGSSMAGNAPCLALTERAIAAFPTAPSIHHPLTDAVLTPSVRQWAEDLGYDF